MYAKKKTKRFCPPAIHTTHIQILKHFSVTWYHASSNNDDRSFLHDVAASCLFRALERGDVLRSLLVSQIFTFTLLRLAQNVSTGIKSHILMNYRSALSDK
jgi:hypothetical protein